MAETVLLPQQGNSVEEVVLLEWKITEGDTISEGDVVCEVETDKATMEVESTASGTVLRLLASAGDEVPVKTPILAVGEPGEDPSDAIAEAGAGSEDVSREDTGSDSQPTAQTAEPAGSSTPATVTGASPRARMRAAERGVEPSGLSGSGPGGRVIERDVIAAESAAPATAAAAAAGGRAASSSGTGLGGRLTTGDLAQSGQASLTQQSPAAARAGGAEPAIGGPAEEIAVTGVRKVIAQRMHASLQETAQLTLHSSADARALKRLRARFKSDGEPLGLERISINDMVMYAVVRSLTRFPALNAHFNGDTITRYAGVDLGFAVDTDRGLLVPTIRGAHAMSPAELSAAAKALAERAVTGKAGSEDLAPATFTVTNLGGLGIERFTPVLNPPQVAILGVSAIELKPVEGKDGGVDHVPSIGLSLTIDHQAVDGAPGARFLAAVAQAIAHFDMTMAV